MIKIRVRTRPENLAKVISEAPRLAKGPMTMAAAYYITGDSSSPPGRGRHGLKYYQKYKHITRKRAYPPTGWQSQKQRRYVMMMIRKGRILPGYPRRTGRLQRGWKVDEKQTKTLIYNDVDYAEYVMGNDKQANLNRLAGWRRVNEVIKLNESGAIKDAEKALKEYLKKKGLE